jgi:hypothetical protein
MHKLLIAAVVLAVAGSAWAQQATTMVKAEEVTWKDHIPSDFVVRDLCPARSP